MPIFFKSINTVTGEDQSEFQKNMIEHMDNFIENRIVLGRVAFSAPGGADGGIPVYQT